MTSKFLFGRTSDEKMHDNEPLRIEVSTEGVNRGIKANKNTHNQIRYKLVFKLQRKMALFQKVGGREKRKGARKNTERGASKMV